jgi:hypothetical protein
MKKLPERIGNVEELEDLLSAPGKETIELFSKLTGDIMFLGVGGKIGPTLARMAKRACDKAGVEKRIFGVSNFGSDKEKQPLEEMGIEIRDGELLDKTS